MVETTVRNSSRNMEKELPPRPRRTQVEVLHDEIYTLRQRLARENEEKGRLIDELKEENTYLRRQVREHNKLISQLANTMRDAFTKCLTERRLPEEELVITGSGNKREEIRVYSEFDI
ncbi:hypothetical protein B0T14DRAFT_501964 [Immersiella caudata]|uniref:Uncharacterized protein n=1 Tax=Immersiella caudata TaxID=314043 RepID=A0AA40CBT0_9PEZI|nr:hypothetical protein B0T14DRAFT_501964 [Immersiella caudata]